MAHQIAAGWNNAGALADVTIQPRCTTPTYGRVRRAHDGSLKADGYLRQVWAYGFLTTAQYTTLLTEFGLASAESAEVTVKTADRERDTTNWNAIISRPENDLEQYAGRLLDVRFDLILVEAL